MNFQKISECISSALNEYRVHLFVFLIAFFIGLTLAHPAVLLNDEFITTNQLRQLHEGHQIIVNEGKYGLGENWTMSGYFAYRSNMLGYSLFLPLISIPAYWMIDITGMQFSLMILLLWTITSLAILLFINRYFMEFSFIGRWQWTNAAIAGVFVILFINLFYYSPFVIDPVDNFPEVLAIVFTNIILLALSAVMIYEINRTIFEDPAFSFFGTIVCLFSSSYFLWSTHCKDHILVLVCFVPIVLGIVRFIRTDEYWYLPFAFLFSGLLAWVRPELALWTFLLTCGVWAYTLIRYRSGTKPQYTVLQTFCSPVFTVIGALPFFLNNYLITKNILLPVETVYLSDGSATLASDTTQSMIRVAGVKSFNNVILMHLPSIPSNLTEFSSDVIGIFFYPDTGSISVFALTPIFVVMATLAILLLLFRKIRFSKEDKKFIGIMFLFSATVLLTYFCQIHVMNVDHGIAPDMRYLSPMYFCLTIIGLVVIRNLNLLSENPVKSIRKVVIICIVGITLLLTVLPLAFPDVDVIIKSGLPLGQFYSIYTLAVALLCIVTVVAGLYLNRGRHLYNYLILLLCCLPFFWQVDIIMFFRQFSGFAGYIFWIPVVRLADEIYFYIIWI